MDGRPEKSVLWSDPELLGYGVPFLACSSLAAGRVAPCQHLVPIRKTRDGRSPARRGHASPL